MDLRRLRSGEWLMAVAAIALLVVVGLDGDLGPADVLVGLLGLGALATVLLVARAGTAAPGVASQTLVLLGCVIGLVVAAAAAMWAAALTVLALAVTTLVAMRDERISQPGRPTDATGVPVESQPEPEHLPAPPA